MYRLSNEERVNSATHAIGGVLGVIALILMWSQSQGLTFLDRSGLMLYGASLIALYCCSTLYHLMISPRWKWRFQLLDHCAIYLLIAGSYTPFLLITLATSKAFILMGIVWSLALIGIVFKCFGHDKWPKLSLMTYLGMGWLAVFIVKPLMLSLPSAAIVLLILGGAFYSLGAWIFTLERIPHHHGIWHLFVLAGSACHFFAIYSFVIPMAKLG